MMEGHELKRRWISRRALSFWPLLLTILVADCTTKRLAQEHLSPPGIPHEVVGETLRLTLTFNQGGAMGIETGRLGLKLLIAFSSALVIGLALFYRRLPLNGSLGAIALAMVMGGATGNLMDRVFSGRGVVDFIDVGVGSLRFWTFNVADIGITVGALLLAWHFWREEGKGAGAPRAS